MFVFDGGDLQSRNYLRLFKPDGKTKDNKNLQSRNYLRLFKLTKTLMIQLGSTK